MDLNKIAFRISVIALFTLSPLANAQQIPQATAPQPEQLQVRIARIEQGLLLPVIQKGQANPKMTLAARMAYHKVPAVSIALVDDGKIAWVKGYGVLDSTTHQAATTTTLFQAGSISKPITALATLALVQQGKLSLQQDINQQLRSWQLPDNDLQAVHKVNLRQLLNHSAGINVHGFYGYAKNDKIPSLVQILDGLPPANSAPIRVEKIPGTIWQYSGGGYSMIQQLISDVSQQPFETFIQHTVFAPLKMQHSLFDLNMPDAKRAQNAVAHNNTGTAIAGKWQRYPESAAAGLWTTASDLALVLINVQQSITGHSDLILNRATTTDMLTRGLGEYGLGFFVEDLPTTTSFSHGGGTTGFRSQLYGYTTTGQGVVIMTNSDNGTDLIKEILPAIAAEYHWPETHIIEK
ncbi:MAG: beta-lactamase family protein [Gammaproteobacteria bacterium]|nr:beta-lactamase family protein [Gammaproteobacteria bacterium]